MPIFLILTFTKPNIEGSGWLYPWILSKDVVLAVLYKVYLVKQVISLVETVQYS